MLLARVIVVVLVAVLFACSAEPPQKFTVMETKDLSYGGTKRMQWKVLLHVTQMPPEQDLKDLFLLAAKDEKYKWDFFYLRAYLPGMSILHGSFAHADFTPSGMQRFSWDKNVEWSPPDRR